LTSELTNSLKNFFPELEIYAPRIGWNPINCFNEKKIREWKVRGSQLDPEVIEEFNREAMRKTAKTWISTGS